jgi:hypothetical protein
MGQWKYYAIVGEQRSQRQVQRLKKKSGEYDRGEDSEVSDLY